MTKPITWSPTAKDAAARLKSKLFATTTEASAILGCDGRTVRAAIEAGQIPAVRTRNTYRIPTAWLMEQARLGTADGSAAGRAAVTADDAA